MPPLEIHLGCVRAAPLVVRDEDRGKLFALLCDGGELADIMLVVKSTPLVVATGMHREGVGDEEVSGKRDGGGLESRHLDVEAAECMFSGIHLWQTADQKPCLLAPAQRRFYKLGLMAWGLIQCISN